MAASLPNQKALKLGRLSLVMGLAALAIAGLFTLTAAGAVLSGNADFLENSRSLNQAYWVLSLAGEALALAGIIMGAAALSMTYVSNGRMDAYKEYGVRLWDIAAGGLIVECAGGEFWRRAVDDQHGYEIVVSNGKLRKLIEAD